MCLPTYKPYCPRPLTCRLLLQAEWPGFKHCHRFSPLLATGCGTDPRKLTEIPLKPAASAPLPPRPTSAPACPVSHVTNLVTATGQLYTSTRYDGILSSWTITSSGLPRDNHFGGIAALELVIHQSVASVIAGGTDDGITVLHMLLSRNQLTQAMTVTGFTLTYGRRGASGAGRRWPDYRPPDAVDR